MQDLEFESSLSEFSVWRSGLEHAPSTDNSFENVSFSIEKSSKRIRKKNKSGFDYQTYINKELEKLERVRVLGEKEKKQVITRIRNRVSAQRSRTKQRTRFSDISVENQELQNQIDQLKKDNALLQITLKTKSLNISPERYELEYENRMLKDTFRMKTELEDFLRTRIKELEEELENLTHFLDTQVVRQSHATLSINTTKTFLFFLGLLMISVLFLGNREPSKYKTMGFDFKTRQDSISSSRRISQKLPARLKKEEINSYSNIKISSLENSLIDSGSLENYIRFSENFMGNSTYNATASTINLLSHQFIQYMFICSN